MTGGGWRCSSGRSVATRPRIWTIAQQLRTYLRKDLQVDSALGHSSLVSKAAMDGQMLLFYVVISAEVFVISVDLMNLASTGQFIWIYGLFVCGNSDT